MKVNLADIRKDMPFRTHIHLDQRMSQQDPAWVARDVDFDVEIQTDPQGYLARYGFIADVEIACVTCGAPMRRHLEARDWVALRLEHPSSSHVVLSQSDMNTRFLQSLEFDLDLFLDEIVELELPSYPRHGEHEVCVVKKGTVVWSDEGWESESSASPFSGLADWMDPAK